MNLTRLQSGHIDEEGQEKVGDNRLKKKAMLVYEGKFESMDGPVELTKEDLTTIMNQHNAGLERLKRMFGLGAKVQVPVQTDHSTKAIDTVGRVDGPITMGTFKDEDGEKAALYGTLMFIGKENVEKAEDGRWTHLSVGLDKNKKLTELSVTPFPAAPHASLLSKNRLGTGELDMSYAKYAKARKHLTKHKGMSEEDADKHLESAKPEDVDKMAADHDVEEEKLAKKCAEDKEKAKEAELSRLKRQQDEVKVEQEAVRLASKKVDINIRLGSLLNKGKITPAEMKKIDVTKLAAKADEVVDEVIETYEAREPVVRFGQNGTTKAADPSKIVQDMKRLKKQALMNETRANMPLTNTMLSNIEKEQRRLAADGGAMPGGPANPEKMAADGGAMPGGPYNTDNMADKPEGVNEPAYYEGMEADYETLSKHLEAGEHEQAKEHLKAMREKMKAHMKSHMAEDQEEPPHQMAAIHESMKELKAAQKRLRSKIEITAH